MTPSRLCASILVLAAAPAFAAAPAHEKAAATKQIDAHELIASISGKAVEGGSPEQEAILSRCSAMKFETSVEVGTGPDRRITKVKMCSREGETKEQWIASLAGAAAKIQSNERLAPDSRAKLVAAIQAEIARLKS